MGWNVQHVPCMKTFFFNFFVAVELDSQEGVPFHLQHYLVQEGSNGNKQNITSIKVVFHLQWQSNSEFDIYKVRLKNWKRDYHETNSSSGQRERESFKLEPLHYTSAPLKDWPCLRTKLWSCCQFLKTVCINISRKASRNNLSRTQVTIFFLRLPSGLEC